MELSVICMKPKFCILIMFIRRYGMGGGGENREKKWCIFRKSQRTIGKMLKSRELEDDLRKVGHE